MPVPPNAGGKVWVNTLGNNLASPTGLNTLALEPGQHPGATPYASFEK